MATYGKPPLAIAVRDLRVQYDGVASPALDGVGMEIAVGARVALVGPNGAGKSTLLKAILGLAPMRSGEIQIHGGTFAERRQRVAYLPQIGELDWRFPISVRGLVTTGRYVHLGWLRRPSRADRERADRAIERMELGSVANRQIGQLSGGQRQRALVARALVQGADTLLLDEPFNAVDAESRSILLEVLDELHRRDATVVLATHELDRLFLGASEVIYLRAGRVSDTQQSATAC
jgi:ABC-type Mn2+/Zn2+ transport system ATPase subunit